jgi:DNA-binding transcriptional LysR family regulator
MMDLRQLRSFLAVIDHGSFSAAAKALFTVQSNVSMHVARLEDEIGTTLLDRRTRQLTTAGSAVELRGREIVRQLNAISDDLAALEDRIIGEVVCGTTPSIGLAVIPPTLARSTRDLPEVSVSVVEAHSGTLMQQLLSGDIDLAITTGASNPELLSTPLFTEDIVAVLSIDHPFAGKASVNLRDLAQTKLILPLQDNPLYDHISQAFSRAEVPLRAALEVGSSALVQAMAAAHVGVALVPATAAADRRQQGSVVKEIDDMPPRGVALTTRSGTQPTRALQAVSVIIAEIARTAAQSLPGCHTDEETSSHQSSLPGSHVLSIH